MVNGMMIRIVGKIQMKTLLALCGLVLVMGGCNPGPSDIYPDKHQVSVGEVRRLVTLSQQKNRDDIVLLVDSRPQQDFAKGHLPGARNIQLSAINTKDPVDKTIDRYKNIVVYGYDPGSDSARGMTKRLVSAGYDNVVFYPGGVYNWVATGGDLVTSEPKQAQAEPTTGAGGQ